MVKKNERLRRMWSKWTGLMIGVFVLMTNQVSATNLILEETDVVVQNGQVSNLSTHQGAQTIYSLNEGSFYIEYQSTSSNQYQSLLSVSNTTVGNQDRHFHIYVTPSGGLGMELRNTDNEFKYVMFNDQVLNSTAKNRIAFKADATTKTYKLFANGRQVAELTKDEFKFLTDITGLNQVALGGTVRQGNVHYPFEGTIDKLKVYSDVLTDEALIEMTTDPTAGLLLSADNIDITQGIGHDLTTNQNFTAISQMTEGTIVMSYTSTGNQPYQSLISISNGSRWNRDRHFHLYITGNGGLGMELRNTDNQFKYALRRAAVLRGDYKGNPALNTVAFKADKVNKVYKIFANGELIATLAKDDFKYINDIQGIDTITLGGTIREGQINYPFAGTIKQVKIYNMALDDNQLLAVTGATKYGQHIFKAGDATKANYYRIPTLLTLNDGSVVSSIDARYGGTHDAKSNIDIAFSRSTDGGQTWASPTLPLKFEDYAAQTVEWPREGTAKNKQISGSAAFIDSVLMEDRETGRLFLFADAMPAGIGFSNTAAGSGYKTINNQKYIKLRWHTAPSWVYNYSIREDGRIYDDRTNQPTEYTVDGNYNLKKNGDYLYQQQYSVRFSGTQLYEEQNGVNVKMNVFYKDAHFKVMPTNYLVMSYSDDGGLNWSDMKIMSSFKEDNERVPLYGPGVGMQIKNGPYAGRLIVSMYSSITGEFGYLYSDDHGESWQFVTTDLGANGAFAEAQVVEMPDGSLKTYMRTNVGKIGVITSLDGGLTWSSQSYVSGMQAPSYGTQLSAINYSGLVDGKPAIILSAPNATEGRRDGRIWIGLVEDTGNTGYNKYTVEWRYSYRVDKPSYGYSYSCLTELPDGKIGVLYEKYDSWSREELHLKNIMLYEQYTINELKTLP